MHNITKNIGNSHVVHNVDLTDKNKINHILICRPNHRLGNLLLITPLLQEVIATFPESKVDLVVQGGLAPILFKNYENVENIIQLPKRPFKYPIKYIRGCMAVKKIKYDIVINAVKTSSSGKLFTKFSNSKYKVFGEDGNDVELKFKDCEHIAKNQVYGFRNYLNGIGFVKNNNPIVPLNLKLCPLEKAVGKEILKELVNNNKKTICLFTYATDDKCHSETWWIEFYEKLEIKYSNYNIIEVLPIENISMIQFRAPTFYSKDIRQIGSLIANTEVFICADSGIMHLASSSQTPTVGLFSRDNLAIYQPFNNNNIGICTVKSNISECIKVVNNILVKN